MRTLIYFLFIHSFIFVRTLIYFFPLNNIIPEMARIAANSFDFETNNDNINENRKTKINNFIDIESIINEEITNNAYEDEYGNDWFYEL